MRPASRKIERLELRFKQYFLTWPEALQMADALLFACSLHCPAETLQAIRNEFDTILTAHLPRERKEPV